MPYLQSLELQNSYAVRLIEADILELLRNLPDLNFVILPEFYLTSTIASELSRKKLINEIQCKHWYQPEQEHGDQGDDRAITARLGDFVRFMNAKFAPINITSLYIFTYVEHQPTQLHTSLTAQAHLCKQITLDTLIPVLSFPNLITFGLVHEYPANITLEGIEELASRWSSIKDLYLNPEPLVMHDFTLDLRALVPFARHYPKLRHIGLFMDATAAETHLTQELNPFAALKGLLVGMSLAQDPDTVAAFLSCLCPAGCELNIGISWTSYSSRSCRELDDDVLSEIHKRSALWKRVSDLLPVLIQLRSEEKENYTRRNCLLTDKINIKACTI
ncbi:hypothetical protein K503DRAFT_799518 [Rhizopogon vinicolor AM-OR11-026]|uniref:Uncharacterized protein n=1 Tax=Rhizopogon vinicolor AM-OR11-026 TaxID=1314800 RepID=A0A1B7N480_9AGAM|nr:hypothetical protein K503DRAFT_799518 [Rhizopogon vinicolor AM-OR11-026]